MQDEDTKRESQFLSAEMGMAHFLRAMSEVMSGCKCLITTIDNHDSEGVEHKAHQSASMWLAAHAAHRRLVHRADSTASADGSSSLLEARTTLLGLFTRAKAEIAVPRIHRLLDELRETLVAADAEPVSHSTYHS
jgi:hypothetical protein